MPGHIDPPQGSTPACDDLEDVGAPFSNSSSTGDPARKAGPGRREVRKAERREAIVEVAKRAFLEAGYDRTTMSEIAALLGGSKGTLWSYFSTKEELFAAALDSATARFRTVMNSVLDPDQPIDEVLITFAEAFITRITQPDAIALQRLIISEVERFPEIGRIFFDRAPGKSQQILGNFLATKMRAEQLHGDNPDEAAGVFLAMCGGGYALRMLWGVESPDQLEVRREATRVATIFLRHYR